MDGAGHGGFAREQAQASIHPESTHRGRDSRLAVDDLLRIREDAALAGVLIGGDDLMAIMKPEDGDGGSRLTSEYRGLSVGMRGTGQPVSAWHPPVGRDLSVERGRL